MMAGSLFLSWKGTISRASGLQQTLVILLLISTAQKKRMLAWLIGLVSVCFGGSGSRSRGQSETACEDAGSESEGKG